MAFRLSVIVCAYNEERYLPACLHSLRAQTRVPDEILVINNASTDATRAVARQVPGVTVADEPKKGLVVARATGARLSNGEILAFLDADCRAPLKWLEHIERQFARRPEVVAVTGPYRYYDWDAMGCALVRAYDYTLAPLAQCLSQYVLRVGAVLYGGNFAVRRSALNAIGGFDTSIEFHGEDTNLGRRLSKVGIVDISNACYLHTSARRFKAIGRGKVFGLYIRNFWSETIHHQPADGSHLDVRG